MRYRAGMVDHRLLVDRRDYRTPKHDLVRAAWVQKTAGQEARLGLCVMNRGREVQVSTRRASQRRESVSVPIERKWPGVAALRSASMSVRG